MYEITAFINLTLKVYFKMNSISSEHNGIIVFSKKVNVVNENVVYTEQSICVHVYYTIET